jgi:hypothetical protein
VISTAVPNTVTVLKNDKTPAGVRGRSGIAMSSFVTAASGSSGAGYAAISRVGVRRLAAV